MVTPGLVSARISRFAILGMVSLKLHFNAEVIDRRVWCVGYESMLSYVRSSLREMRLQRQMDISQLWGFDDEFEYEFQSSSCFTSYC